MPPFRRCLKNSREGSDAGRPERSDRDNTRGAARKQVPRGTAGGHSPHFSRQLPGTSQGGFTYLALLFAVVVMGFTLALTSEIWSTKRQREKEQELLFVGQQFREAIGRYYELSPLGNKIYPATLEDLLQDPRFSNIQRHLRQIYDDPISETKEWGGSSRKRG